MIEKDTSINLQAMTVEHIALRIPLREDVPFHVDNIAAEGKAGWRPEEASSTTKIPIMVAPSKETSPSAWKPKSKQTLL